MCGNVTKCPGREDLVLKTTTAVSKHYASSDSVYFVSERRKCLAICDGERGVFGVYWLNGQLPLPRYFGRKT